MFDLRIRQSNLGCQIILRLPGIGFLFSTSQICLICMGNSPGHSLGQPQVDHMLAIYSTIYYSYVQYPAHRVCMGCNDLHIGFLFCGFNFRGWPINHENREIGSLENF